MELLTLDLRFALCANAISHEAAQASDRPVPSNETRGSFDPVPVVKFFLSLGAATWLATEMDRDGDTLFGLADLGFGCPELGYFSLREIASIRLPFGLTIERDLHFETPHSLTVWADAARAAGSIMGAAHNLSDRSRNPLPTDPEPDGSGEVG
ncbi:hypothetical protein DMC47_35250 [Nostoc sp. 3335mG]|nr:hypothetical protein DMC47_35250 [Nostoc sp. 3335mG]